MPVVIEEISKEVEVLKKSSEEAFKSTEGDVKRLEERLAQVAKQLEGIQKAAVTDAAFKNALSKIADLEKRIKALEAKK
ncbi:MAG: hypothetical protein L0Y71_05520 [Gemmataceae bacterium]|nr:hypothetical protein [Gemmataceae bacterium]